MRSVLLHLAIDFAAHLLELREIFEMILNVDAEIWCQIKSYGVAFTYSVFLAPAWPPEG